MDEDGFIKDVPDEDGVVKDCLWTNVSDGMLADYHKDMNADTFEVCRALSFISVTYILRHTCDTYVRFLSEKTSPYS
jgi:hypothetical protein